MPRYHNKEVTDRINKEKTRDMTLQGIGQQLTQERLASMQKDAVIGGLGQQVTALKLQIINIQGGTK